jgi:hypothetical protein
MKLRTAFVAALVMSAAVAATGCGHVMMMMHGRNLARPSATEFGTGPRASASRQFTATLQPDQPLRPRRMHTLRVAITDAAGVPVDDATIQIVRFNMGGWWEFKLAINAASGSDVVTFNLAL